MRQRVDRTDQRRADAHRRGGTQRLEAAHDHEERQTVCEKAQDRGDHEYRLSALVGLAITKALAERRQRQHRGHQHELVNSDDQHRSEEHTSELQSLMRISYAVFCLKKKKTPIQTIYNTDK